MTTEFICPDCGQRYDPGIERGLFLSARGVRKRTRAAAQDVREPGHRQGEYHSLIETVTQLVRREEWVPIACATAHRYRNEQPTPLYVVAFRERLSLVGIRPRFRCRVYLLPERDLEYLAFEVDGDQREHIQRIQRAAALVRAGHPWWLAWALVIGVPIEQASRGVVVGRGDLSTSSPLWRGVDESTAPTLPGMS